MENFLEESFQFSSRLKEKEETRKFAVEQKSKDTSHTNPSIDGAGDLGAGLIADKTHISPVTCIFARVRTQLAIPISRRSLMEHRITVRNRWKSASTPSAVPSLSLTRLFDSNYFPSTADCRAATSPNFRKPRVSLFFLLSRTVRGLPAPLVYSWLAPRKPRINFSQSFSSSVLTLSRSVFIAPRFTITTYICVHICSSSISSLYSFFSYRQIFLVKSF